MYKEIWKPIIHKYIADIYEISTFGRIRNKKYLSYN
jgi:hypothetical protein